MALETVEQCPICHGTQFEPSITCTDYTATGETFPLTRCTHCSFVVTNPRPRPNDLPRYYEAASYISHTGKSHGLLGTLYRTARLFTTRWKTRVAKKLHHPGTVLDYGCGTGELLHQFKLQGWQIHGLEPSSEPRQRASQLNGINIAATLDQIEYKSFDLIMLWHVLEHIENLESTVEQLRNILAPGGVIIFALPNRHSYDATHYSEHWAGYDVPRHLWHFAPHDIVTLAQRLRLKHINTLPMKLDAYYVSLLSEKYKAPRQSTVANYVKGIFRGFISNQKARASGDYSSLIYAFQHA